MWDYDALYTFLKAPGKDVPGTNMTFVGLKKPEDRIAIIAYLHSLGSKLPVPPPRPAAAAAPAAGAACRRRRCCGSSGWHDGSGPRRRGRPGCSGRRWRDGSAEGLSLLG
jgi:hypothetical protein